MKILDRLPIPQAEIPTFVGEELVRLKKAEIIVWVSLSSRPSRQWNPASPRFPVIVDTGHTHNFAIQQQHLVRWAGIQPEMLRSLGQIRHGSKKMPLVAANLWLHHNEPKKMDASAKTPFLFDLPTGIAVYPDGENYPRLPLLGLRAILGNHLHLAIDGQRASVTLRTPDWRTWLLSWLA